MHSILVQMQKEWSEFKRDRLSLALAFLLPFFSLLLFGFGIRLELRNIPLVVRDNDNTQLSREYINRIYAANLFSPIEQESNRSLKDYIDRGVAKAAISIPKGFTRLVFRRQTSPFLVLIDGTDIANVQVVSNSLEGANLFFLGMLKKMRNPGAPEAPVKPELRLWFNPGRSETLFIVPGAFAIVLWMFPALLTAVAASREKEQKTIIRVYASNANALAYLLGKSFTYFIVSMCMAVLVIGLGMIIFSLGFAGDPTPFLVSLPIYVFVSIIFGLCLGTYASSQTVAVQATSSIGFFPALLLSGFVYPIANIPFPLSLFCVIVPARYFVFLCRDAFVKGTGWPEVWPVPLILLGMACFLLALSWLGVKDMQEKE